MDNEKINDIEEVEPSDEISVKTVTTEELGNAISSHDKVTLERIFEEVPDIDIAEACEDLDIKELITLFRDINSSLAAPLFDELSQDKKEELVKAMTDKELVTVVSNQAADDLADTVGDMPANLAKRVL